MKFERSGRDSLRRPIRDGRSWIGIVLALAGILLLVREFGYSVSPILLSWPVLVIVVGFVLLLTSSFRKIAGYLLILSGIIFLFPAFNMERFMWPVALVVYGIFLMFFRPNFKSRKSKRNTYNQPSQESIFEKEKIDSDITAKYDRKEEEYESFNKSNDPKIEYLDETAFFGSINKAVYSKNFGGGDVNSIFAGVEINLLNAEFTGTITIECNQIFGGLILRVPANWHVRSESAILFGGFEDKRISGIPADDDRCLVIRGNLIFGGLEIRN